MYKMIRPNYQDIPFAELSNAEMCLWYMVNGSPDMTSIDHLREACQQHLKDGERHAYSAVEITIFAIFLSASWFVLGDRVFSDRTANPLVYDVKVTLR